MPRLDNNKNGGITTKQIIETIFLLFFPYFNIALTAFACDVRYTIYSELLRDVQFERFYYDYQKHLKFAAHLVKIVYNRKKTRKSYDKHIEQDTNIENN